MKILTFELGLTAPKYMWLDIGEGEGHIWEQRSEECLQDIFKKIQEKWCLFQRFVTSIVASFYIQSFTYSLSCDNWLSVNTIHDNGKPLCGWNSCIHSTLSDNCQNLMKPSSLAVASTDPSGDKAPSVICYDKFKLRSRIHLSFNKVMISP